MKRVLLVLASALLTTSALDAGASAQKIPSWLLGEWAVTKIYEEDMIYPEPSFEPKVRLDGKTLVIEPDRLSLVGEVCTNLEITEKHGTIAQILMSAFGVRPKDIALTPRKGAIDYLAIRCHRSFTEETSERTGVDYIKWRVVFDPKDHSEIELAFLGGAYLKLRRPAPTS